MGPMRLPELDLDESGQHRPEPVINPLGDSLCGGVLQPFHLVEITVIQRVVQWLPQPFDLPEVDHPARVRVNRAREVDHRRVVMAMEPAILVSRAHMGQMVCGAEMELDGIGAPTGRYLAYLVHRPALSVLSRCLRSAPRPGCLPDAAVACVAGH